MTYFRERAEPAHENSIGMCNSSLQQGKADGVKKRSKRDWPREEEERVVTAAPSRLGNNYGAWELF